MNRVLLKLCEKRMHIDVIPNVIQHLLGKICELNERDGCRVSMKLFESGAPLIVTSPETMPVSTRWASTLSSVVLPGG